ncbi:PREDICTED: uncharacterized protein LOC104825944 [Tarenaya hassleriana]|uniref:uncharacterized protein LOC104825944 n=1 Tax=Tarenaya hassleriana TaxID=28532 RepID=UPI00053C98BF|nr:PREDICTED: uncharacterized protein LOC104825944 [Tarenaya hassleriana]XP_010556702.1 PREDICTED: uncharacterized protein LOC104825944 [Tarenaya hassleriana]
MDTLCLNTGIHGVVPPIMAAGGGGGVVEIRASAVGQSTTDKPAAQSQKRGPFGFSFKYPLTPFWSGGGAKPRRRSGLAVDGAVLLDSGDSRRPIVEEEGDSDSSVEPEGQNGNWVLKILHVNSTWRDDEKKNNGDEVEEEEEQEEGVDDAVSCVDDGDGCDVCSIDDDDDDDKEKKFQFDRESFSRLLKRVSLNEAKLYAQLSYLGSLAYSVSKIKPANLLKYHGLRFVTSSAEKMEVSAETQQDKTAPREELAESKEQDNTGYRINVAAAASYLKLQTEGILPFKSSDRKSSTLNSENALRFGNMDMLDHDVASLMTTTNSVTAVVAAEEDVKQAVADDLKSTHSSPCDWFICDDDHSHTRFFVIQGSESFASWQANLLFEPIEFEGFDILVHRGIYEAAKGMYEQMLPEVRAHFKSHGNLSKFRFTGHSLGGSLSLLLNLMLLIRGEVPPASLLPVITFGAPFIMCGGDRLLSKLGLPKSYVQAITMHRDIVPRAFSCRYPEHVTKFLKAVNVNFRNLPCLNKQSVLYVPMGELLILQPDEKFSPGHDLLPFGSGLYVLKGEISDIEAAEKQLRSAQTIFLDSPHPLEILSDRSAYGSGGTIQRDHDMNSYLKSVRSVIRKEVNRVRKAKREQRRSLWWPIMVTRDRVNSGMGQPMNGQDFSGMLKSGRESVRRFSRLVASQHMHLIVVLLFPVKLMFLGAD